MDDDFDMDAYIDDDIAEQQQQQHRNSSTVHVSAGEYLEEYEEEPPEEEEEAGGGGGDSLKKAAADVVQRHTSGASSTLISSFQQSQSLTTTATSISGSNNIATTASRLSKSNNNSNNNNNNNNNNNTKQDDDNEDVYASKSTTTANNKVERNNIANKHLALELKQLREKTLSTDAVALKANMSWISTTPYDDVVPPCENAARFLHDVPLLGEVASTVVVANGARFFLRPRKQKSQVALQTTTGLLGKSMKQLQQEVHLLEVAHLSKSKYGLASEPTANSTATSTSVAVAEVSTSTIVTNHNSQLWVDKYIPQSFTHLLSSEQINRQVLKAVKAWDPFVFRNKARTPIINDPLLAEVEAVDTRPLQKVILLAGPPGTGKTTLAHIIAKQCGYRVIEVNASDDRNSEVLKDVLERTMLGRGLFAPYIPNCVIFDEIDGIDNKNTIDMILNIVKAPLKSKQQALVRPLICICNDIYTPSLRELRKYSQIFMLKPPNEVRLLSRLQYICSVEDLPIKSSILSTLISACGYDIRASINTLQFAAIKYKQMYNNAKKSNNSKVETMSSLITNGLKDDKKDILTSWRTILSTKEASENYNKHIHMLQEQRNTGQQTTILDSYKTTSTATSALTSLTEYIIQEAIDTNDTQLLLNGVFENIYRTVGGGGDVHFNKTSAAATWFSDGNVFDGAARMGNSSTSNDYALLNYIPYIFGPLHLLCAVNTRVQITWPKQDYQWRLAQQRHENILQSILQYSTTHLSTRSSTTLAVDLASYLTSLLLANYTSSTNNSLVQNTQERLKITHAASLLNSLGFTYITDKSATSSDIEDSKMNYVLDPPIHQLISYHLPKNTSSDFKSNFNKADSSMPGTSVAGNEVCRAVLVEARKLAIAQKIKSIQDAAAASAVSSTTLPTTLASPMMTSNKTNTGNNDNKRTSTSMEAAEMQLMKKAKFGKMDMFMVAPKNKQLSRTTATSTSTSPSMKQNSNNNNNGGDLNITANKRVKRHTSIYFKYNSSYSNAVKRPAPINEFL